MLLHPAGSITLDSWSPSPSGALIAVQLSAGGTEDSEHEAGYRADKQNVFDDLHAAAQHLIDSGWTSPDRLGIQADPTQARWWALR